jgi:hypothetical protein
MEIRIVNVWLSHQEIKGVKSAKLVVLFDGNAKMFDLGLHRIGALPQIEKH